MEIKLGSECIDLVTGFKGIAVARTVWLNGCARVTLQPKMGKDAKVPETVTFDEPQLKLLKAAAVPQDAKAISDARASSHAVMTDLDLAQLAAITYIDGKTLTRKQALAFIAGYRECEKRGRSFPSDDVWPTDNEVRDYFQYSKDLLEDVTPFQAFEVIRWLKERMGAK